MWLPAGKQCVATSLPSGKVSVVVRYAPKILKEMEWRFEHVKSFRRGVREPAKD